MSDTAAPAIPDSSASTSSAPVNDNAAAGAVDNPASEAAKTLNARRAEIRAKLASAKPESSDTKDTAPASGAKSPESASQTTTGSDSPDDIQALIREDRRIKAESKRLEISKAELKEYEADVLRAKTAREHLGKGDRIAALKALFPGEDLTSDLFWDLAKAVGQEGEGAAQPDIEKVVAAQVEAKLKADADAAAKRRDDERAAAEAGLNDARNEYISACGDVFKANQDKFPAIHALGVRAERIQDFVEKEFRPRNNGRIPSTLETLQALEEELSGRIRSTPYAAQAAQPARANTVSNSWRSDPGRPANDNSANKTLDQIREERRALLRQSNRR